VLAAGLALVAVALGVSGWWFSRFPARSETLGRPPFALEVQRGVPATEVVQIRAGLLAIDDYLRSAVGVGVQGPVQVRVSWSNGCRLFLGPQSVSTAWVDGDDFICLNAAHRRWRSTTEAHVYNPAYVAAHEHVHNLQAQLGCFREGGAHEWQWLFEGMASELAYRALVVAGLLTEADAALAVWEYRGLQDDNGTLADYEQSSDDAGNNYGLFHLGARAAAREAGTPKSFAHFCRTAGAGLPWRTAFHESFGIPVEDLYAAVEAERGGIAGGDRSHNRPAPELTERGGQRYADRLQHPAEVPEPASSEQLGGLAGRLQSLQVTTRVGRCLPRSGRRPRTPRASSALRWSVRRAALPAVSAPAAATESSATCAVTSQLPSGTGATWRPSR
jgi:hypothetical protein